MFIRHRVSALSDALEDLLVMVDILLINVALDGEGLALVRVGW